MIRSYLAQKIVLKIKLHRANDSLRFMINKTIYDLANFFHLDESDFDSAKVYYSISLKNATTDEEKSKIIFSQLIFTELKIRL